MYPSAHPVHFYKRRLPIGAEIIGSGVHFRVWAPQRKKVELVIVSPESKAVVLEPEENGYHSMFVAYARQGTRYRYRLDDEDLSYPDPASRFQPDGPEGPSEVIDPSLFQWTDEKWAGVRLRGQVIYEMHIGVFTPEGTWRSAARQLKRLADTGITLIEVMPVSEFPGRFGWGYDGVDVFAPTRLYGAPDEFRHFVNQAHSLGLGVILDVVYNHFGPEGNYIEKFFENFFTDRYKNEWGKAVNFDGHGAGPVRLFFTANAGYWIKEFHLDGFRFDATQQMFDCSPEHILCSISREARNAAGGRSILLIAENEPQQAKLVRSVDEGGYGLDAIWNDDFHHSAKVAITGHAEAYYTDYRGSPQEFISIAKRGFLYQGQYYSWQRKPRGSPTTGIRPESFVQALENHDQIANSARGRRCHQLTGPGTYRAMTALFLLLPGTPMIFQGQEYASSRPFLYFAEHRGSLAEQVKIGRSKFLAQFQSLGTREAQSILPDPSDLKTYQSCILDYKEEEWNSPAYALHRDLLKMRREDPVFRLQADLGIDGAVLDLRAFVLRYFGPDSDDRLVLVNLGPDLHFDSIAEPLMAPPEEMEWITAWSSEDVRYGGGGTPPVNTEARWNIPGCAAVVMSLRQRKAA
jgi:maltooligosyltrehalose trehalohydrolase